MGPTKPPANATSAFPLILLQKSKVASDEIFGQIPKREAIADYVLSRVTELAYDFNVM
jgi:hypothetical protein